MYTVYALVDPRTNEVHYIGCSLDVQRRFKNHLDERKGNAKKRAWIADLKGENLLPEIIIIEEGLKEPDAFGREAHWIRHYADLGAPLTNAYRPDPKQAVQRTRAIHYTFSQANYDYLVSLGREAVLQELPTSGKKNNRTA